MSNTEATTQSTSVRDGQLLINAHRWLVNINADTRSLIRDYRRNDGRWDKWPISLKDMFLESIITAQPMFEEWLNDEPMFTAGEWRSVMSSMSFCNAESAGLALIGSIRTRFDDIMRTIVDEA